MPKTQKGVPLKIVGWCAVVVVAIAVVAIWLVADPGFRGSHSNSQVESSMPKDEFERRVRAYLLEKPEVLREAIEKLREREASARNSKLQAVIKSRADELYNDPTSPVGGNLKGDVTLVEFFDYNCPYCRRVAPVMDKAEAADGKLRIVYKEFPILGQNSMFAALAALAADRQGKYLPFHKALMAAKGGATPSSVMAIAEKIGLDLDRLKADMKDPIIKAAIERNIALAQALRINGTPGFVVGNEIIRGAIEFDAMKAYIERARAVRQPK